MKVDNDSSVYVGLISGTSADGIDAVLVRFARSDHETASLHVELIFGRTFAYPAALRAQVLALSQQPDPVFSLDGLGALDTQLGQAFAAAANMLIEESAIDRSMIRAIGSHGQTLRHRPSGEFPFSMQLGDANVIAERTGLTTVADFVGAILLPAARARRYCRSCTPRCCAMRTKRGRF